MGQAFMPETPETDDAWAGTGRDMSLEPPARIANTPPSGCPARHPKTRPASRVGVPAPPPGTYPPEFVQTRSSATHRTLTMIDRSFDPPSALRDWLQERKATGIARLDALRGYPTLKRRYLESTGYPLDLDSPRTVGDKVNWRKIHDRDPIYPVLADKLRVRDFVAERIGQRTASELFPKLYQVVRRASELDLGKLPLDLVIKANHACGWMMILRGGEPVDPEWVRRVCGHWLRRSYLPSLQEWAYRDIPPRVLVEELLTLPDGRIPDDIKFHMYDGQCRRCSVITGRCEKTMFCHYTPDWRVYHRVNEAEALRGNLAPDRPRPVRFGEMLKVAERLSAGRDYLRIDFLDLSERFTLTEITLYPRSGYHGGPYEHAVETGRHWRNPRWE